MSSTYFKNFFGLHCTDFELLQVSNPKVELTIHVTLKCVEAGALLGSLCGLARHWLADKPSSRVSLLDSMVDGGSLGVCAGAVFGPIASLTRCGQLQPWQVYDRCYRLRFNTAQLNIDRAVLLGGIVGYSAGGQRGMVFGINLATLISGLFYVTLADRKSLSDVI